MNHSNTVDYRDGAGAYPTKVSWGMNFAHKNAFFAFDASSKTSKSKNEHYFFLRAKSRQIEGVTTYVIKPKKKTSRVIFYIHGGAYVKGITLPHVNMLIDMAKDANAEIYAPLYTLADNAIYPTQNNEIYRVYMQLCEVHGASNIILMGDSVGATFSLTLMHQLNLKSKAQPKLAILIAPVIDLHLNHEDIPAYEKKDRVLSKVWLSEAIEKYLGKDYDNKLLSDPLVSPKYIENLSTLPPTLYIIGNKDLLYPDAEEFVTRAKKEGMDITYICVKGGFHVFPLSPTMLVPEAVIARKQMLSFMNHQ